MKFIATQLPGVFRIDIELHTDERGWFARMWCEEEFTKHGLSPHLAQCSISFTMRQGTVRGMHWQAPPHAEDRLVRCTRGSIHDVVVDVRKDSPTFTQSLSVMLTADNHTMLYIPAGCAHGFQTLKDMTEVFYHMSVPYASAAGRGVRWNDPAFTITWPLPVSVISKRDEQWPDFVAE